jgi:CheY-like chemotaxis protein
MDSRSQDSPLILIVDHVETNIEVLANLLSERTYRIASATSGEQAVDMARELRPDLILLDIMMPGMDGLVVCRTLKTGEETCEIPIIFLTARTETQDIVDGFEAGALDHVTKPFQAVELLARVQTHIELKEALDRVRVLSGLLPICSFCKKIRDDRGYWNQAEAYITKHSDATFSHGICPACAEKHFPDLGANPAGRSPRC